MEERDFLGELQQLLETEDVLAIVQEVGDLKDSFQQSMQEKEKSLQRKKLESKEEEATPEVDFSEEEGALEQEKEQFFVLYQTYRDRKIAVQTAKKLEQEANLRSKQNLISRLKSLIAEEENIGTAIGEYKTIHETWKNIGDIPRDNRQEIQSEYSKLLESFFFNIKIYRELKDHDLKRNLQLKLEVVEKIQQLAQLTAMKDVESGIKALQNDFDETGPVPQEEWEQLKENYWGAVKQTYARIQEHYDAKREAMRQHIEEKKALLVEVEAFMLEVGEPEGAKEWEEKTATLLAFQETWKKIGFGPKKENEELWTQFRAHCDVFFDQKKVFFDQIKGQQQLVADKKKKIIARANELKTSQDWKKTSDDLRALQQEWKKAGSAGQRHEQVLWKEFRSACDSFFDAKQKHFEEADKQNETNLAAKEDVVAKIEAYVIPSDKKQALADLREFSAAFAAVGNVPYKDKDRIYQAYKNGIDGHYSKLKLEGDEKEKAFFQAKMDNIKASPDAANLIDKERKDMRNQITNLQQEILQYENNLGFFAQSKGADVLRKEVDGKIAAAKKRIEEYKRKLKMLVHE